MKTNQEIANCWSYGKDAKNVNLTANGRYLISYSTAIAYKHPAGINLLSEESFSQTTAGKHLPAASRACHGRTYYLDCFVYGNTAPDMTFEALLPCLEAQMDKLARLHRKARTRKDWYANQAEKTRELWNRLAKHENHSPCPYQGPIADALQTVLVAHRLAA